VPAAGGRAAQKMFERDARGIWRVASRLDRRLEIGSKQLVFDVLEATNTLPAGVIVSVAEKKQLFWPQRVVGRKLANDRFRKNATAFIIVTDDGMYLGSRQVDVYVLQSGRVAYLDRDLPRLLSG
jgi:hypothetical protein